MFHDDGQALFGTGVTDLMAYWAINLLDQLTSNRAHPYFNYNLHTINPNKSP